MPTPAKRPDFDKNSSAVEAILSVLRSRAVTFAPGTVVGAGVYVSTGQIREALLACVLGPPAVKAVTFSLAGSSCWSRRGGGGGPGGEEVELGWVAGGSLGASSRLRGEMLGKPLP